MQTTTNLGLKVWNLSTDQWTPQDLVDNWNALEADYSRARTSNKAENLAAVPGAGNFQGRLVYLTADNSGFKANSLIRYDGSTWQVVGPAPERHASLPTTSNYQGRVIVLTGAAGGFAASDVLVNTDGANSWKKVGGIGTGTSLPGSPSAGDMFLLTAPASGFEAYSLVAYNGSAWARTEKRGIELGTSLPGSPFTGQVFEVTTAVSGWQAYDVLRYNGSSWERLGMPSGSMVDFGGASAPTGWLLCDGSAVSRTTYASLFTAIGTLHGVGDGSTTFNVPDTRGRVTVGKGTHTDIDTVGDNDGIATVGNRRPKHKTSISDPGHVHVVGREVVSLTSGATGYSIRGNGSVLDSNSESAFTGITAGAQTGAEPTDTVAYTTVLKIIKV